MANSFVRYTGDNSTTSYSIPFSYRSTADLTVTLAGSVTTAFSLNSAGTTLTFNSAPAQDAAIEIRRRTSQTTKLVDYASGSVLTENDLDTDSDQAFFMSQEAIDDAGDVIKVSNTDFQWDAQNKRLTNVADPTAAQHAATKNYLENTWLSATDKATLNTVNSNMTAINTVNSNITAIGTANTNSANITTVANNIGSVNTVATDISKVIAVANDLAEAVSEIETVADDLNESTSEIDVVSNNIANVNIVGGISSDITSVAGIASAITAVNNNSTNINAVNTNSSNINTVAGDSTEINAVAGNASNINSVAGITSDITSVAGISTAVTAVNNNSTNINAVNSNSSNINTVAGMQSAINTVNSSATAINAVNANATNINTVAGANTNITNVAGGLTNINTVATNLASVNNFAEQYRISSSAPTTSLNVGDLYFDTTANELKVYKSSGWAAAGSTVNGTSQRYTYNITSAVSSVTGSDANGNTLAYDAGYADVYLNGVRLSSSDITITSGTSVVFASALSNGDVVDIVAYGTFNVASINAANIDSGTINDARLPTTMAGKTLTTATVEANSLTARGDGSSADGKITLNCSQNSHGVSISSPNHASGQSYNLILPTSVGTSGQVLATAGSNTNQLSWVDATETKPTVADVSQTIAPATATTINITGTNFVAIPIVEFIKTDGSITLANTVSFTNATTLSVNVTLATGNYHVRVENPDGNAGRSTNNILTASTAPTFSTSAGSLGTIAGDFSGTVATIAGSSDSAVTFSETTSVLSTANCTLSSAGVITTTDFGGSSTTATTYNFIIRITDAEGQTADRSFSLTSSFGATGGGQFN
ncbi:tail fiber [Pelagibacter phage HTVC022P]|nr:tail fiber [Pelagibacter phage HTVC022P]